MIQQSFIFLEKINTKSEINIWKQGIRTWSDFLKSEKIKGISKTKKIYYNKLIRKAQIALMKEDTNYFLGKLPSKEMWRLYPLLREESCFLDIEVDSYGKIILVGISNYFDTNFFVKNINLEKGLLTKELAKYKMIVTFNGGAFDLPKLRKEFNLKIILPHLDLKPLSVYFGLKGALKKIEKKLNLKRPLHLKGNPIELWKAFLASGDEEYFDLLIEYNREDCENLKLLADFVLNKKIKGVLSDLSD